jgi:hypothetical protein
LSIILKELPELRVLHICLETFPEDVLELDGPDPENTIFQIEVAVDSAFLRPLV